MARATVSPTEISATAPINSNKLFITSLDHDTAQNYLAGWLSNHFEKYKIRKTWLPCKLFLILFDEINFDSANKTWRQIPLDKIKITVKELGEALHYTNASVYTAINHLVTSGLFGRKTKGKFHEYYFTGPNFPQLIETDQYILQGEKALKLCQFELDRQSKRKNRRGSKGEVAQTTNPVPLLPKASNLSYTVLADKIVTDGLRTLTTAFNELIYDEKSKEIRQISMNWMQFLTDIRVASAIEDPALASTALDKALEQSEAILLKTTELRKQISVVGLDILLKEAHLLTANVYELRTLTHNQPKLSGIRAMAQAFKNRRG